MWTDHTGMVHERHPDDLGLTLCGLNAGKSNRCLPVRVCRLCIDDSLRRYALAHDCSVSCLPFIGSSTPENSVAPYGAAPVDQFPAGAPIPGGGLSGRSSTGSLPGDRAEPIPDEARKVGSTMSESNEVAESRDVVGSPIPGPVEVEPVATGVGHQVDDVE